MFTRILAALFFLSIFHCESLSATIMQREIYYRIKVNKKHISKKHIIKLVISEMFLVLMLFIKYHFSFYGYIFIDIKFKNNLCGHFDKKLA